MTNNSQGINGILLQVAGLTATTLSASDFIFRMSPQGVFNEAANPPSGWASAPAPSNIVVTPGSGGSPATVRIEWPNNVIENRWLQTIVLNTANTGLASQQAFYLGNLRGDIDGQIIGGAYTVLNADLAAALPVGGVGTVSGGRDVDRNGFVLNSDFVIIRSSINSGLALRNITIPAAGSGFEGRPAGTGTWPRRWLLQLVLGMRSSVSTSEVPQAVQRPSQTAVAVGPACLCRRRSPWPPATCARCPAIRPAALPAANAGCR